MQNNTTPAQPLPVNGTIDSRIGPLTFEGGYPTDATVTKLYDEMDFQRATPAYIWANPIVSFAKWQEQHENVFGQEDGDLVQFDSFIDRLPTAPEQLLSLDWRPDIPKEIVRQGNWFPPAVARVRTLNCGLGGGHYLRWMHSRRPEGPRRGSPEHEHSATAFTTWLDLALAIEQARAIEDAFSNGGANTRASSRHSSRDWRRN